MMRQTGNSNLCVIGAGFLNARDPLDQPAGFVLAQILDRAVAAAAPAFVKAGLLTGFL